METMDDVAMSSTPPRARASKPRKAKPSPTPKGKRSLNLSIPVEDHERLAIHALRQGTTISELVCGLARQHLREYHITRTPGGQGRAGEGEA